MRVISNSMIIENFVVNSVWPSLLVYKYGGSSMTEFAEKKLAWSVRHSSGLSKTGMIAIIFAASSRVAELWNVREWSVEAWIYSSVAPSTTWSNSTATIIYLSTRHSDIEEEIQLWPFFSRIRIVSILNIEFIPWPRLFQSESLVILWLRRVVAFYPGVFGPSVLFWHQWDTTPHALLDKEVLVVVCEQLKLNNCFLKRCIPGKAKTDVVVGGVWPLLPQASFPKGLEDDSQEVDVRAEVKVVVVSEVEAPDCSPNACS